MDLAQTLVHKLPQTPLVQKAIRYAHQKHAGELRRISPEPFIHHPLRVALLVTDYSKEENILCSAILHDVVENTPVTLNEIESKFGHIVATTVNALTDDTTITDRTLRKQDTLKKLANANHEALLIKTADIIDNTADLIEIDKSQQTIPWSVFHSLPEDKLTRWRQQYLVIENAWPQCPLLQKLDQNLDLLTNIISTDK